MKKTLLLLLTLLSVSVTNAQIVNIPDPGFKSFLRGGTYGHNFDTNDDGEIQVTEAEAYSGAIDYNVNYFDVYGYCDCLQNTPDACDPYSLNNLYWQDPIHDLTGLEAFKNVSSITLNAIELTSSNSIFLNNFNNLTSVDITFIRPKDLFFPDTYTIPTVDLSNNPNLVSIALNNPTVDDPNNPSNCMQINNGPDYDLTNEYFDYFPASDVRITNLIANNLGSLNVLFANNLKILNLDVLQSPNLTFLNVEVNNLTSLDVSNNPNLENLWIGQNNLTLLDVSNNPSLISLKARNNNLSTLDVSNNTNIEQLSVHWNNLTTIDVSNLLQLKWFFILNNNITSLDISNNINLLTLNTASNNLTTLDVSNITQLTNLLCGNNNSLTYLNLKNGNNANFNLTGNWACDFGFLPNLQTVCVDDINSDLTLKINTDVGHAVVYTEYCSLTPAQSNTIRGLAKIDLTNNGCDSNDVSLQNILVSTTNGTDSFGTFVLNDASYTMYTNEGNFTTQVSTNLPSYFTVTPATQTNTFTGFNNTFTADFCIAPNQTVNDVNISLTPVSQARTGFNTTYQIIYKNIGTIQLNGNVTLEFDETKLSFLNASETVNTQTSNSLTFNYANLNPFETRTIDLEFNVFTPPTVEIDDILNFTATINPIASDFTADDNIFNLNQTVIGSFDPNDIICLEGNQILLADVNKYLHYVIRFQNTGTASAINVVVTNDLDTNLDWSTLQLENLSHNNRVAIKNGNEIEFIFENINLPDSTTDEPNSHGFIAYKIKPKADIVLGDIIPNKADIFFDFNAPIETNTATTTIVNALSVNENTLLDFSVYPTPTENILNIKSKTEIVRIEIYSKLGQLIKNTTENQINISNLTQGLYFVKVEDINGNFGVKKIVKK